MTVTATMLEPYLNDLEARIVPEDEEALQAAWETFWEEVCPEDLFSPSRQQARPPALEWPAVNINDTLDDTAQMLLHQLSMCSGALASGAGLLLAIRSNYGVGTLATLFGAELYVMDRAMNTLPNTKALPGGADGIRRMLDAPPPSLADGLGARVFATDAFYTETLAAYPKISQWVHRYHPDLQGPMDICELLWGSELFADLYDEPELVHACLQRITDVYIEFLTDWRKRFGHQNAFSCHWGMWMRGQAMLRDDSAMNLSPAMVKEFILPYNQQVLSATGGGTVHACGRVDHYIEAFSTLDGLYAFNMSQPHMNDMETVYRHTVDKGIRLIGLNRQTAEEALQGGRLLYRRVHVL